MFAILALVCFVLALFHAHLGEIDLVVLGFAFIACHLIWGEPWFTSLRTRGVRR